MSDSSTIHIRDLQPYDIGNISKWPPYPAEFEALDYALREKGWLSEYSVRSDTQCFVLEREDQLIAFTILCKTGDADAEFRIAMRGDLIGTGLGHVVATLTFEQGFSVMGLDRIHLIVRKNNPRAARLYRRLGFAEKGELVKDVNGKPTEFLVMDLLK